VGAGWNLISVPVIPPDMRASVLFPHAISHPFSYDMGYNREETLRPGVGYWLKFAAAETVQVVGQPIPSDTVAIRKGWNLIGAMSLPIAVNQVNTNPSGIIISKFFGYNNDTNTYIVADNLDPGKGFWVKASQSGTMRRY